MVECREVQQYNVQLKEENLNLGVELGKMRKQQEEEEKEGEKTATTTEVVDKLALEAEFQRRLVEYLDPVKECMTQVLGHTGALTDSLTRAMHLVSAPGRRSRSMAAVNSAASILMQQKGNSTREFR